jgi:hypothetical protein
VVYNLYCRDLVTVHFTVIGITTIDDNPEVSKTFYDLFFYSVNSEDGNTFID